MHTHGGPEVVYSFSAANVSEPCGALPFGRKDCLRGRVGKSENGPVSARHVRVKCVSKYFPRYLPPKFQSFVRFCYLSYTQNDSYTINVSRSRESTIQK